MANTGNKQAVIAYRVRTTDGAPLDINGKPTSESGLKQAIALLEGTANPNPALYVVQFYFQPDAILDGNPTVQYDPEDCAAGFIFVTPSRLVFDDENLVHMVTVISSADWGIYYVSPAINVSFTYAPNTGGRGSTEVTISTTPEMPLGEGYVGFINNESGETARIYLIHVNDASVWILDDGTWNMRGFWLNDGIWNY